MLSKAALASIATPPTSLPPKKWIRYSDRQARASRVVWNDDDSPFSGSSKGDAKFSKKRNEDMDTSFVHDSRRKIKSEKQADSPAASTNHRNHPQERKSVLGDKVQDSRNSDPSILKPNSSRLSIESTTPVTSGRRDRVIEPMHTSSRDRPLTHSKQRRLIASTSHEPKSDSRFPDPATFHPASSRPFPSTPPATTYKRTHIVDKDKSISRTISKKPHKPHTSVVDDELLDKKPSLSSIYQEGSSRNPIQLTPPSTTDQRSRISSMCTSSTDRKPTTSIRPQKLFVCRELGLPPTPYTSRRIQHSSSVSPPPKLDFQKSEDEQVKKEIEDDPFTAEIKQPKARRESRRRTPIEQYPGQNFMREIQRKRKEDLDRKRKFNEDINSDSKRSSGGFMSRFEIDAENNFGVGHVFNEVARDKATRKQMHGVECECCAGYYEQAAKDLRMPLEELPNRIGEHKNDISRHRHFNPPPTTPPGYWQMGFPDTQQVEKINREAQENKRRKLEIVEAQARNGVGPYKIRT